jgi:hypothetical protein
MFDMNTARNLNTKPFNGKSADGVREAGGAAKEEGRVTNWAPQQQGGGESQEVRDYRALQAKQAQMQSMEL